jgi:hypothetical protein
VERKSPASSNWPVAAVVAPSLNQWPDDIELISIFDRSSRIRSASVCAHSGYSVVATLGKRA